ncbi:MAG: pyridoxamine 5'-phosphate oxidase [Fimbriimonadaceae bacterium]|nr:pyridoxamine 5'-phosphate oxidase [Fimbriimonadaceae bacterium]
MSGDAYIGARKEYASLSLDESMLGPDPILMLREWIEAARQTGHPEPSAMCLGTVSHDGQPSGRMLLLRGLDHGLIFYTNYQSRKAEELSGNGRACMTFWWPEMERQVRVEGRVEKVAAAESDAYFASRPYESQVASAASPQSRPIASRIELEKLVEELSEASTDSVPRPENWGGYRLIPSLFEFWQGRPARLHDRFEYRLHGNGWVIQRLAP